MAKWFVGIRQANYIKALLLEPEKMKPMVFVNIPDGHSIESSQKFLNNINMDELRKNLSSAIPNIEAVPMITKIIPVELKPNHLVFHVIVVANFDHDFEYEVEKQIADFLRESIAKT